MNIRSIGMWTMPLALLFASSIVAAQNSGPDVVGSGSAKIKHDPQVLRMQMSITAEAPDVVQAATKLKTIMDADRDKLKQLGATDGSIDITGPNTGSANPQAEQMRMQMMMARNGGKPASSNQPVSVSVYASITAEWPAAAGDTIARLTAMHALEDKIKTSELAGPKQELTPEQKELQEEAAQNDPSSASQPQPGQPTFSWVWKPTVEERQGALADACKQAQTAATTLAKAAGCQLGELRHLTNQSSTLMSPTDMEAMQYMRMLGVGGDQTDPANNLNEAVSIQPGPIALSVTVEETWSLK